MTLFSSSHSYLHCEKTWSFELKLIYCREKLKCQVFGPNNQQSQQNNQNNSFQPRLSSLLNWQFYDYVLKQRFPTWCTRTPGGKWDIFRGTRDIFTVFELLYNRVGSDTIESFLINKHNIISLLKLQGGTPN